MITLFERFFSAFRVARVLPTTSKYHQIYTTFLNFEINLPVFSYYLYQPCDPMDFEFCLQQFWLNGYKLS